MSAPRRPTSLLLLLLFFCWVDARALGGLVFPQTSASYHFHDALGQRWLHVASQVVTAALAITATGYLWRARHGWLQASLVGLGAYALSTVAGTWYMLRHLDVARAAYATSRQERGLPVPAERLAEVFTPGAMWTSALVMLALLALLAGLAWRNRDYVRADA